MYIREEAEKIDIYIILVLFRLILTSNQIDLLVIHWFGFILDLTVGFWLLHRKTRPYAILFCSCFHLMNSRLFSIGI